MNVMSPQIYQRIPMRGLFFHSHFHVFLNLVSSGSVLAHVHVDLVLPYSRLPLDVSKTLDVYSYLKIRDEKPVWVFCVPEWSLSSGSFSYFTGGSLHAKAHGLALAQHPHDLSW